MIDVWQVPIQQDQGAGFLRKQHLLQHRITCSDRTVTQLLQTRPVFLLEVIIITLSRTLFHPMRLLFRNQLPIQRQLQQQLQLQRQQLQQLQLLQQQQLLPFRISNKWVSVSCIAMFDCILMKVIEAIGSFACGYFTLRYN